MRRDLPQDRPRRGRLPAHLRWKVCRYLGQPYLPLPPAAPRRALWCAACGECVGAGGSPWINYLCFVHCRARGGAPVCMACWQAAPHHQGDLEPGAVHYGCQCWHDKVCTCGPTPVPVGW